MQAASDRGAATIITCGLNRAQLVALRERTARNVRAEIVRFRRALHAGMLDAAGRHLVALKELCALASEFAGMNCWWVEWKLGWTWEDLVRNTA